MNDQLRPRRSVLYMPAANERALEKAKTIAADALILDLEDAVAPDSKEVARANAVRAARSGEYGEDFRAFERMMHDRIKGDGGNTGVISLSGRRQTAGSLADAMKSNAVLIGDTLSWSGAGW